MKNIGYTQKKYRCEVKRYCQTLDLKDNPELISEYKLNHSREKIWPEIIEGIKRLFMIVETPLNFDWDSAMEKLSALPRQQEWEDYMSIFQSTLPGSTSSDKWKQMERMFHLY